MSREEAVEDSERFCFTFLLLFAIKVTMSLTQGWALTLAGAFKKMLVASFLSGKTAVQSQLKLPEIHLGLS